jgi:NNP family nitrate/nitrite transporter-like MFS transporter
MSSRLTNQTNQKTLEGGSYLNPSASLGSNLPPLFFLTGIFFLNFFSRIVFAPLLPTMEQELHLGHKEAGVLFLLISVGYSLALLVSGYLSSRVFHRKTIFFSTLGMGIILLVLSVSQSLWSIRPLLFLLGVCAGFYLPSGIATLTSLIRHQDWGKAIAIHELAPNMSFVMAPFIAEAFLQWGSWRQMMALLGIISLTLGTAFFWFGRGGNFFGQAPTPQVVRNLIKEPSFWIVMILFGLGIGTSFGIYSMLPLYLVVERGIGRGWANTLIALSRVSGIGISLVAGLFVDRLGVKKTLLVFLLTTGVLTILLGVAPVFWLIPCIFLQPMVAVCFFPAGFTAISRIGSADTRNVVISLAVPLGFVIGGGVVPALIGWSGERLSFSMGIILVGIITTVCAPLVRGLRFSEGNK